MKTVLVTGGAGFIGSALCRLLVSKYDLRVINVDKLTYAANLRSLASIEGKPNYSLIQQDICDKAAMIEIIQRERPDTIIHLAAESHVDRSITGPDVFLQTNIMGTYALLEATRAYFRTLPEKEQGEFRFVHVSTDEVYGSLGADGLFHEESPYAPSSPYAASKAASDHLATAWCKTFNLPMIISNCSNNYGPYQFPEKLIPLMTLNAWENKPLPIYGNGQNVRDWLHVDDHAEALYLIASKGIVGEKYNVGGNNERTNLDVVKAICATLDEFLPGEAEREALIQFVSERPGHDKRYAIDSTKLHSELGWAPQHTFETGIKQTVTWYLQNEHWWRPLRDHVYSGERLGLHPKIVARR